MPSIVSTVTINSVNDAPTTTAVTLAAIAEDSGGRLITQAELLGNAADVDGAALTATGLPIATGNGSLIDNGNGTWTYTPALNDDSSVSFTYTVTDGRLSVGRFGQPRHHPGERCADDRGGDAARDRRGQRRAADHAGRAAGQCDRCRQCRADRHRPGDRDRAAAR